MGMENPAFSRVRVTIIDGAGCGEAINRRERYPFDTGVNSILHASQTKPLDASALQSLGLGSIPGLQEMEFSNNDSKPIQGAYGALTPSHVGNGSPEGHQALMGYNVKEPYLYFDKTGFPPEVVQLVQETVAQVVKREVEIVRYPETDDINGVKFINTPGIGDAHVASAKGDGPLVVPIYASSDSLIQIALHQGVVPQETIKEIGKAVREAVDKAHLRIGRIIMRPFEDGKGKDAFDRVSADRIDFGVDPDGATLLDVLAEAGVPISGFGKAASMLNYHGVDPTNIQKLKNDEERMQAIVDFWGEKDDSKQFGFDNLVGTDELWGHPRKSKEWSEHITMISKYIAQGMLGMTNSDLWIITADHGNDPKQEKHNNHTNEMVPLLVYSPKIKRFINLGVRQSFADVAKTVAENFGVADKLQEGESFLHELI